MGGSELCKDFWKEHSEFRVIDISKDNRNANAAGMNCLKETAVSDDSCEVW